MNRIVLIAAVCLVAAALIGGFAVVGGPEQARMEERDRQRLMDLRRLGRQEVCRRAKTDDQACPRVESFVELRDPKTDLAYQVRQLDDGKIEVCATFETDPDLSWGAGRGGLTFDGQTGCLPYRVRTGAPLIED